MKKGLLYLLKYYALTVALFIIAKWVFMLYNAGGHHVSFGDYFAVARHGLTLDLSTALYALLVPLLVVILSIWIRIPAIVIKLYNGLIATAFSMAFVADTCLYEFWGFKLDVTCLQYLSTPTEAMASVSLWYLLVRLIAVIVVALGIYLLYSRLSCYNIDKSYRSYTLKKRLIATLLHLLLIPAVIIGIRGGLSESTTNIGQVFYSQNQFLNHAAINPVFNFLAYIGSPVNDIPEYHFMDDNESKRIAAELYPTESITPDSLLNTSRPNVVVILLESCGSIFTAQDGRRHVMPRFSQLMDEGISFDSCYANSWRTDRGTVCTWSGYPSFPMASVIKMPTKAHHLPGIAKSLKRENYRTSYLYGGDINFTNMRSYLISTGFETLRWKADYSLSEQSTAKWGVRDDITFRTLYDMIEEQSKGQQHFLIGYSTLSSHEPWDVPIHQFDDKELNGFYYLDQCIGDFVDRIRQTPAWDNLLVILLPDHSIAYKGLEQTDITRNHIPMVWIGGAVKTPRHINMICNQTDLAATLLGQMGIAHDDYHFSRDVMSENYQRPFAIHTYNNGISMINSTTFTIYDLTANRSILNKGEKADSLMHIGKAVLQAAALDLKEIGEK